MQGMSDSMRPSIAPPPPAESQPGRVPTFSVLTPAYQAADTVAESVASALAQTVAPLEVIVCDDGSADDIEGALARYRDRITLLRKENGGGASALNIAARAASGDFVVVLDADDAYFPERIEALGELGAARPDLDILTSDALFELGGEVAGRFNRANRFPVVDQRAGILTACFIFAPAVRRKRLLELGGWDESFAIAYDWDCWMRLILSGAAAGLVDEPLTRYRLREGSLSASRVRSLEERVLVLEKAKRTQPALSAEERGVLEASLALNRRRVALTSAEAALLAGAPDARRRALDVVLRPGIGARARLKAAGAVLAPRSVGRRLVARDRESGTTRLRRPDPRDR